MDGDSLTHMGLTLALLLGIPALLLVLLRRFGLRLPGQPEGPGRLGIVSRLPIDARHSLLLVRRDTHEQLILLGPAGATLLEAEVKLSTADVAEHRKQARRRKAQAAASRAALRQVGTKVVRRVASLVRATASRVRTEPRFHRLVERKAAPVPVTAAPPRTRRPRRRASAA